MSGAEGHVVPHLADRRSLECRDEILRVRRRWHVAGRHGDRIGIAVPRHIRTSLRPSSLLLPVSYFVICSRRAASASARNTIERNPVARLQLAGEADVGANDVREPRVPARRLPIGHQENGLSCRRNLDGAHGVAVDSPPAAGARSACPPDDSPCDWNPWRPKRDWQSRRSSAAATPVPRARVEREDTARRWHPVDTSNAARGRAGPDASSNAQAVVRDQPSPVDAAHATRQVRGTTAEHQRDVDPACNGQVGAGASAERASKLEPLSASSGTFRSTMRASSFTLSGSEPHGERRAGLEARGVAR